MPRNAAERMAPLDGMPAPGQEERMSLLRPRPSLNYRHPVNIHMMDEAPLGARIADRVTGFLGSWWFLAIQSIAVGIWLVGNIYIAFHFDPYPFILLNLAFSMQAAYAAPLILLASNRAAKRDRLTLEHAADEADIAEQQNERLLNGNTEILKQIEELKEQVLRLEKQVLERHDAGRGS